MCKLEVFVAGFVLWAVGFSAGKVKLNVVVLNGL